MHPYVILLARLILGGIWALAAISKLLDREASASAVAGFGLLPERVATAVGRALPFVELALGLLLLTGWWLQSAAAASAALLALFTAAIAVSLLRGQAVECHCFGQAGHAPISGWSVARNLGLIAVATLVISQPSSYLTLSGWANGTAFRAGDPSVSNFVPVALLAAAAWALLSMGAASWRIARAIAMAGAGPFLRTPEGRFIRRWRRPARAPIDDHGAGAGEGEPANA